MRQSTVVFNLIALCALWFAGAAQAQTVYRIVGPDGKVTFSDKAPLDASKATAASAGGKPIPIDYSMEKLPEGWKIMHDHTSAEEPPRPVKP